MTEFVTYNIDKDTEVDWCRDYNVNALNLDSLVFENCSDFCADDNVVIHIVAPYDVESNAENVDEFDVSDTIEGMRYNGIPIVYALYSHIGNYLVGFVTSD